MCKPHLSQWLLIGAALLLAGCAPVRPTSVQAPIPATPVPAIPVPAALAPATPAAELAAPLTPTADRWAELHAWAPYPHTTPLPPQAPTLLDGLYVRDDPRTQARVPCRRCPPYPPEGGVWVLEFDAGVFRVYHPRTGWRTLGSYTVDGERVTLFNDPQCHLAVGHFTWVRSDAGLTFAVQNDDCELGTRAKAFTAQVWESCQPPDHEAAATGHWPVPAGCDLAQHTGEPTPKAPTLSQ